MYWSTDFCALIALRQLGVAIDVIVFSMHDRDKTSENAVLAQRFLCARLGRLLETEEITGRVIVDCDVQVGRSGQDVSVPGGVADFGQCAAPGQSMADERVAAVMDRQPRGAGSAQGLAGRAEAATDDVAVQPPTGGVSQGLGALSGWRVDASVENAPRFCR